MVGYTLIVREWLGLHGTMVNLKLSQRNARDGKETGIEEGWRKYGGMLGMSCVVGFTWGWRYVSSKKEG